MRASLNTITSIPLLSFNFSLMEGSVGAMVQPLALLQLLMLENRSDFPVDTQCRVQSLH